MSVRYYKSGAVRPVKLEVQKELAKKPVKKLAKIAKERKLTVDEDASKTELIEALSEEND
jgi:hypothetical protein